MKRLLSLILAVVMCVSVVPMTLIDALAHGRGVGGNDIENQSITNLSQLPEQVVVDGVSGDTAWNEKNWNIVSSKTGTWDVKDPLHYDYSYKYQLRKDGDYFYGIIILDDVDTDAVVTVWLNDGTAEGCTDKFVFNYTDGSVDFSNSRLTVDGEINLDPSGVMPQEAYQHVCKVNDDTDESGEITYDRGKAVIEFRSLIKAFSDDGSALSSFVSVSVEGVQGEESLYYPRVPYKVAEDVIFPSATTWPEEAMDISDLDIANLPKSDNEHQMPDVIDIDGEFRETVWTNLTAFSQKDDGIRNSIDFRDHDYSAEHPNGYAYADIVAKQYSNRNTDGSYVVQSDAVNGRTVNSVTYKHGMTDPLKFKYDFRVDSNNFYGGIILHNGGSTFSSANHTPTVATTASQVYIYIFKETRSQITDSNKGNKAAYTIVLSYNPDAEGDVDATVYTGYHDIDTESGGTVTTVSNFNVGYSYMNAEMSTYSLKLPLKSLDGLSDGFSYSIVIANSKRVAISGTTSYYPRTFAFATKNNLNSTSNTAYQAIRTLHYAIDAPVGKGTDSNGHPYSTGNLNARYFAKMLAADSEIYSGGMIGWSADIAKGDATAAECILTADYDYLYGAAIIKKEDWKQGDYSFDETNGRPDIFRIYLLTDSANLDRAIPSSGEDADKIEYVGADGYLSFYINKNGVPCVNYTEHSWVSGEGMYSGYTSFVNQGKFNPLYDADVVMEDQGDGTVLLEFRVPLNDIDVDFDVTKIGKAKTLLNYYYSVENLNAQGRAGMVYPKPADYSWFYKNATNLKCGVFYVNAWNEVTDKHIWYNSLLETFTPDGSLHEEYWDNDDDLAYVSQFNGVWQTEPQNSDIFDYRYNIYVGQDHLYGAAKLDFESDANVTSFDVWINTDYTFDTATGGKTFGSGATHRISISLDEDGNTVTKLYAKNGTELTETAINTYYFCDAERIDGYTQIEFAFSLDAFDADRSGFSFCVSCTDLTDSGETLTLYHFGQKEGWSDLWVTHFDTYYFDYKDAQENLEGNGTIFSDLSSVVSSKMNWNDNYLFVPANNYADADINKYGEGVYIVHGVSLGTYESGAGGKADVQGLLDALNSDASLTSTEGAFVYSINVGNYYQYLLKTEQNPASWLKESAHLPDFTSYASAYNTYNYISDFTVGTAVMFKDLDTETFSKSTALSDGNIYWFENGFYNMEQYKTIDASEPVKTRGNGNLPTATKWHKNAESVKSLGFYNREMITIDGTLGDSGWDDENWTEVTLVNGTLQTTIPDGSTAFDYKYQIRTDGEYLYVGALLDTDIYGKMTEKKDGTTVLTDLIAFRLWLKSNDVESRSFTSLYDLSLTASQQTITGVKYTSQYDEEDGSKTPTILGDEKYDLGSENMKSSPIANAANGKSLYTVLRFAETNGLGRDHPAGGLAYPLYDMYGYSSSATVDNYYNYGSTSLYGYTERIEENTVDGKGDNWHSKPVTETVTFANEHGKMLATEDGTQTVVEFKVALDEFGGKNGFEYYVQASSTSIESDPYTLLYPSAFYEPSSAGISSTRNLPYWLWYTENSVKIDDEALISMKLRDSYGPVTTLGAKIIDKYKTTDKDGNEVITNAIRFGAYYNEDFIRWPSNVKNASDNPASGLDADLDGVLNYWDIAEVGMLITPTVLIPDNTPLTHDTVLTSGKPIDAPADAITDWYEGSNLADYETMVYHVPVKNVPENLKFTFVPYVDYYANNGTETYYGISAERSYNYVLNALGGNITTNENVKAFWITHMDDHTTYLERAGAGMIFTEPYGYNEQNVFEQRMHWMHIAFAPTHVEGVYEVVEMLDGTPDGGNGIGNILSIPKGGFVWVAHNSKYDLDNGDADSPDTGSDEAIAIAREWSVGDTIKFNGLTLGDSYNIPTTTPTLDYTDAEYVCTATVEKVDLPDEPVESEEEPSEEPVESSEEPSEEPSEEESSEEPDANVDDSVIVYIPLDDRPVNYERVIYAAESAGFTMLVPPLDDVKTVVNDSTNAITLNVNAYNQGTRLSNGSYLYGQDGSYIFDNQTSLLNTFGTGTYWWKFVSFTPIEGNEYQISEIRGGSSGVSIPTVPTGGFVWAGHDANKAHLDSLSVGDSVVLKNFNSSSYTLATVDPDESDIGNRVKNFNWLKGIYENGYNGKKVKYYVIAYDQLFSGGLAGDRVFAALYNIKDANGDPYYDASLTVEQNLAKWENGVIDFLTDLAADEDTFVVSMDTVMRLASTTTDFRGLGENYGSLREYGGADVNDQQRKALDFSGMTLANYNTYLQQVLNNMDTDKNGNKIDPSPYGVDEDFLYNVVFKSRERKFRITQQTMMSLYEKDAEFDYYYIGIADAHPGVVSIQNNEIDFHNKMLALCALENSTLTFDGTDELGLNGIAACAQDRYGDTVNDNTGKIPVNVTYFGGGENDFADKYGTQSLKDTVDCHLIAAGAYADDVKSNTKLQLLVLSRVPGLIEYTTDAYQPSGTVAAQKTATQQLLAQIKYNLANDIPTMVINAVGSNGGTMYFGDALFAETEHIDIMKLYGYSQWNTVGNAVGIAIGNGISRYAYLKDAQTSTLDANVGFLKAMTTALVKDIAYIGATSVYAGGRGSTTGDYYNVYKDKFVTLINASEYYATYGTATDTPHVIIGGYDNLDNWANRNFEAQIPVNVNIACGTDFTDVELSNKTDGAQGVYDSASNTIAGYNGYYGLVNDGIYADPSILNNNTTRLGQFYTFRSDYNGDWLGANGNIAVNTVNNIGTLVFNFGEERYFDRLHIQYGVYTEHKVYAPESVKIYVSDDGENWNEVSVSYGDIQYGNDPAGTQAQGWMKVVLNERAETRHVKVEIETPNKDGSSVLLGEIAMVVANDITDNAR